MAASSVEILGYSLLLSLRLVVGAWFVIWSFAKLRDLSAFKDAIRRYALVPEWAVGILGLAVPTMELLVGLLLVSGAWVRASTLTAVVMVLTFSGAIFISLVRGRKVPCGCSGSKTSFVRPAHLARNAFLIAVVLPIGVNHQEVSWSAMLGRHAQGWGWANDFLMLVVVTGAVLVAIALDLTTRLTKSVPTQEK